MSRIEWTNETWNPIVGCSKCSPGCDHCYAEAMARRLKAMGVKKYRDVVGPTLNSLRGEQWTGKIAFDPDELDKPLRRKKPTLYFVDSMGDLFHENVHGTYLDDVFNVIYSSDTKQHFFLLLTKRIENFRQLNLDFDIIDESLVNVGVGVTVCNQAEADEKIPVLLQIPAALRFVSIEPMLGMIDLTNIAHYDNNKTHIASYQVLQPITGAGDSDRPSLDWVICGGESGPGARPVHPDWVRGVRDQCHAAGVPFFFKQWGEWGLGSSLSSANRILLNDGMAYEDETQITSEHKNRWKWLKPVMVSKIGKKRSGHLVDGVEYRQVPEVLKRFFKE